MVTSIPVEFAAALTARLLWFLSVYFTAKMILNAAGDADLSPEERSEAGHTFEGASSEIERKGPVVATAQPASVEDSQP